MKGNDWMRHCAECNLNVYNFSAMSWKEVERLIASHQGRLCARLFRRADGTVLTQDCPRGVRAVVRRISRWAGAALSALSVVSLAEAQNPPVRGPDPLVRLQAGPPAKEPRKQQAAEQQPRPAKKTGKSAGMADPPPVPRTGQPHAVLQMTVSDITGTPIPAAKVRLTDQESGKQWGGVSDSRGGFSMPVLPLGTYKLSVEMPGFAVYEDLIDARDAGRVNLRAILHPGAMVGLVVIPGPTRTTPVDSGSEVKAVFRLSGKNYNQ